MSFYIQLSEEEMSEEIVFGDESYEAAVADGSLTDETRKSERARERETEREREGSSAPWPTRSQRTRGASRRGAWRR